MCQVCEKYKKKHNKLNKMDLFEGKNFYNEEAEMFIQSTALYKVLQKENVAY